MNALQQMVILQKATVSARTRMLDKTIATQVKAGQVQITRVTYNNKGKSTVLPVSGWMSVTDAVEFLDRM